MEQLFVEFYRSICDLSVCSRRKTRKGMMPSRVLADTGNTAPSNPAHSPLISSCNNRILLILECLIKQLKSIDDWINLQWVNHRIDKSKSTGRNKPICLSYTLIGRGASTTEDTFHIPQWTAESSIFCPARSKSGSVIRKFQTLSITQLLLPFQANQLFQLTKACNIQTNVWYLQAQTLKSFRF